MSFFIPETKSSFIFIGCFDLSYYTNDDTQRISNRLSLAIKKTQPIGNTMNRRSQYRNMMNEDVAVKNLVHTGERGNQLILLIKIQFEDRERERLLRLIEISSYNMIESLLQSNLFRTLMHQVVFDSEGLLQLEDFWVSNYDENSWLPLCGHSSHVHDLKESTVDFGIGSDIRSNISKMQRPGQVPSDEIKMRRVRGLRRAFNWDNLPRIEAHYRINAKSIFLSLVLDSGTKACCYKD